MFLCSSPYKKNFHGLIFLINGVVLIPMNRNLTCQKSKPKPYRVKSRNRNRYFKSIQFTYFVFLFLEGGDGGGVTVTSLVQLSSGLKLLPEL